MGTTRTRRRSNSDSASKSNGRANTRQRKPQEYEEEPDFGSAFRRHDNEPPQPEFTGTGMLSRETLKAIAESDGEFQLAVWVRRAKSGTKYLRVHIEGPWLGDEDDGLLDDEDADGEAAKDDDDLPF